MIRVFANCGLWRQKSGYFHIVSVKPCWQISKNYVDLGVKLCLFSLWAYVYFGHFLEGEDE